MAEIAHHHNLNPSDTAELAQRIGSSLNKPEFLATLDTFEDRQRDAVIGGTIEYLVLDLPPEHLDHYLGRLHEISQTEDLGRRAGQNVRYTTQLDVITRKLAEENGGAPATPEDIFHYVNSHLVEHGYIFHGFNGAFESSIREEGLSPSQREWDLQDMQTIHGILQKAGRGNALGWLFINSTDKLFVTESTLPIYRYATSSPEWFNQFISGGHYTSNNPAYDKHAFQRRDYDAAKHNITLLCSELMSRDEQQVAAGKAYPNITSEESETIHAFFEKYWQRLAGQDSSPKLALIPREVVGMNHPFYATYAELEQSGSSLTDYMGAILYDVDARVKKPINASGVAIAELPDYSSVHQA